MKYLTPNDLSSKDYKYINRMPDADFSPEHNQAVISKTIKSGMQVHLDMKKAQRKDMEDRIDIFSTYGPYALNGGEKTLEKFVGKRWMAEIYGEKIMEKIRVMDTVRKLNRVNGNTKFENFVLS